MSHIFVIGKLANALKTTPGRFAGQLGAECPDCVEPRVGRGAFLFPLLCFWDIAGARALGTGNSFCFTVLSEQTIPLLLGLGCLWSRGPEPLYKIFGHGYDVWCVNTGLSPKNEIATFLSTWTSYLFLQPFSHIVCFLVLRVKWIHVSPLGQCLVSEH